MAEILKLKVNNQWVGVQAIKGEQGEQGPTGETGATGPQGPIGATGPSGVAVSTTEPTDPDITVWVDPDGTEAVEANPTMSGGETALTGLRVGEVKYTVGGSGSSHLYQHNIYASGISGYYYQFSTAPFVMTIITDSNTPFTFETFCAYITANPNVFFSAQWHASTQSFQPVHLTYVKYESASPTHLSMRYSRYIDSSSISSCDSDYIYSMSGFADTVIQLL